MPRTRTFATLAGATAALWLGAAQSTQLAWAQAAGGLPTAFQFQVLPQDPMARWWHPGGLDVSPDGGVYVADTGNDRVVVLNPAGRPVATWGRRGTGEGEFEAPVDVAVARDGTVVVADAGRLRLQLFRPDGTFLRAWGSAGNGNGQFVAGGPPAAYNWPTVGPVSVAGAPDGSVYVTELGSDRVQRFALDGAWLGGWHLGADQLGRAIAVARDGTVVVTTRGGPAYRRFTPDGRPLEAAALALDGLAITVSATDEVLVSDTDRVWRFRLAGGGLVGRWPDATADRLPYCMEPSCAWYQPGLGVLPDGTVLRGDWTPELLRFRPDGTRLSPWYTVPADAIPQRLLLPTGVGIGAGGDLWTTDYWRNAVAHYGATGEGLGRFGGPGNEPGQVLQPRGLGVAADGTVYIADYGNDRVQHWSADGRPLGRLEADFDHPDDLDVATDGTILVSDAWNDLVRVFAPDGRLMSSFGGFHPENPDVVSIGWPRLASLPDGNLLEQDEIIDVNSPYGNPVRTFDRAGRLLRSVPMPRGRYLAAAAPDGGFLARFESENRANYNRLVSYSPAGREQVRAELMDDEGSPVYVDNARFGADGRLVVADGVHGRLAVFGNRLPEAWYSAWYASPWLDGVALAGTWLPTPSLHVNTPPAGAHGVDFRRSLALAPGLHQLRLDAAGGVRLWLAGQLVVDRWQAFGVSWQGTVRGGTRSVRLAYRWPATATPRLTFEASPLGPARSNLYLPLCPR